MLRRIPLLVWFLMPTFVLVGAGVWFLSRSQPVEKNPIPANELKNKLKEIIEKDSWKIVLAPRDKNDSKIALVAWGRVLAMDQPDYDKIAAFIQTYRNHDP